MDHNKKEANKRTLAVRIVCIVLAAMMVAGVATYLFYALAGLM